MNCPILSLCKCCGLGPCQFCIQLAIAVSAMVFGGFLILQPKRAIDIQIAFYRFINWKMEPVSMRREILSTRIMGAALVILVIASVFLAVSVKK